MLFFLISFFAQCSATNNTQKSTENIDNETIILNESDDHSLILGAERLDTLLPMLEGKTIGLVVNHSSRLSNGIHLVDTLLALGIRVKKVFAPEHGFRGDHSAGAHVKSEIDEKTGLSIASLYGKTRKPTPEMLSGIDILIFDIQDVGVRFYTYISTMHYIMEACAPLNKKVIVLDRPNPNIFYVDGPVLAPQYQSFIGMHPIPMVHGLTVAELALMINGEGWLKTNKKCDLAVIPCLGYDRETLYELPIAPSPNLPNMNSVYLYPYLGLFEGTNVSVGRGTDKPFQILGRPGYQGEITFTPQSIPGVAETPKFLNKECGGVEVLDVSNGVFFAKKQLNLHWLIHFYETNRTEDGTYFKEFFYKLSGNEELRKQIESGISEEEIRKTWQPGITNFLKKREPYLLYQ
jgi:uncharacterized protein YbbC (DUF1343 family)